MKKIAGLLAAVLVFVATATTMGPVQEVQAFSSSEINYSTFRSFKSSKAGSTLYFYYSLDYATQSDVDLTGWKAAICPAGNATLAGAVVTFDISNANKQVVDEYRSAYMYLNTQLATDIPEGAYTQVIFDAEGNVKSQSSPVEYINKSLVYFNCDLMNNDGYAYAYVYADNIPLSAATYPTLYAADKSTAVTSFSDYTTEVNEYGENVHIYRLNILDQNAFTLDSDGLSYLYCKVGTPNLSVSGSDAVNDGGIGMGYSDADGFGYLYAFNLNDYIQRYGLNVTATSPFAQATDNNNTNNNNGSSAGNTENNSSNNSSNNNSNSSSNNTSNVSQTPTSSGTVNGQNITVTVSGIQNSEIPEVQTSINNVVNWTNQIASQPAEVVRILNQYAPSMQVSGVTAGGSLDIAVPSGTDISSGARITFTDSSIAANVRSGDKVVVLHVKHDGSIEYLPAEAGDGTITATFTSLSPVAWFKVSTSNSASAGSPKTGLSFWGFLLNLFR